MTDADADANGEDPDLLLTTPAGADGVAKAALLLPRDRRKRGLFGLALGLLIAVPVLATLAGALTSPPHARSVPVGHLVYLEADEPSDHTAILRGLRVMGPDGSSRQLLHETEPQDQDAGSREWISQPAASPDGHWLAFEKQIITLQEEQQGIDNQLWVMPLSGPNAAPRMLLDLTRRGLKQFIGLAWTADNRQVLFSNGATGYGVAVADGTLTSHPLTAFGPADALRARTLDGSRTATTFPAATGDSARRDNLISVSPPGGRDGLARDYTALWGWSVFGGRRITALKWSPDGQFLAYSVSKPPLEDELFYIDLATGQCFQLPVRTGRAGWAWAR